MLEKHYYSDGVLHLVPQPSVNISQSVNGSVSGLNHILTCKVTPVNGVQPSLVMISWTGGSSLSSSPRVNISDQTNDGVMYTRTVTFSPLLNGDDGQYNCSVSVAGFDEANNSSSVIVVVNGMCALFLGYIVYSCNMGTSDLPDIYAQSLSVQPKG